MSGNYHSAQPIAQRAPTKKLVDITVNRFAKYGPNAARLHKFTGGDGWDGRLTDQTIEVEDGPFGIDTSAQKTMYGEIAFAK